MTLLTARNRAISGGLADPLVRNAVRLAR